MIASDLGEGIIVIDEKTDSEIAWNDIAFRDRMLIREAVGMRADDYRQWHIDMRDMPNFGLGYVLDPG